MCLPQTRLHYLCVGPSIFPSPQTKKKKPKRAMQRRRVVSPANLHSVVLHSVREIENISVWETEDVDDLTNTLYHVDTAIRESDARLLEILDRQEQLRQFPPHMESVADTVLHLNRVSEEEWRWKSSLTSLEARLRTRLVDLRASNSEPSSSPSLP